MPTRNEVFAALKHRVLSEFTSMDVDKITEKSKLKTYVSSQLINNLAILLKQTFPKLPATNLGKTIRNEVESMGDLLDLIEKYEPVKINPETEV